MTNRCPNCGAPYTNSTVKCEYCGTQFRSAPEPVYQPAYCPPITPAPKVSKPLPVKRRTTAALLALLLGNFGIHKFYLGQRKAGLWMLAFCWTYIPALIGFIDLAVLLSASDQAFMQKYNCRIN